MDSGLLKDNVIDYSIITNTFDLKQNVCCIKYFLISLGHCKIFLYVKTTELRFL